MPVLLVFCNDTVGISIEYNNLQCTFLTVLDTLTQDGVVGGGGCNGMCKQIH